MAKPNQLKQDPVVAARAIAQAEVARRWPELADIEPTVAPRQRYVPDAAELNRLGATGPVPAMAHMMWQRRSPHCPLKHSRRDFSPRAAIAMCLAKRRSRI